MQSVPREWLDFLRQQFPKDSRIQLTEIGGNPRPISPGSTGKLDYIDDAGQFHVKWDNGCTLALVLGEDRFSVYLPEPQTFKLYMPLTADFYGRDEWGDMSEDGEEWDGRTLMDYEGQILSALVKNRVPEENESGLMRWYGEDDSVDHKVRSAVFTVEVRNRQLWGVAECRVAGELTPEELIINLPHPTSAKHPRMPLSDRAAQFAPFAALSGHSAALAETARLTDQRMELDEDARAALDLKQQLLLERIKERPEITVTWFQPDAKKDGGRYIVSTGRLKRIHEADQVLVLADGLRIPIGDIVELESECIRGLL